MSGIYIHIPFCAKKCFYCDFYVTLSIKYKDDYLKAIFKELKLRKNYLKNDRIETIYFGGGTPSLLNSNELNLIIENINKYHKIKEEPEITLEANPDDLTIDYLKDLKKTPINRLSIGIQSFFDDDLQLMNRRHRAEDNKKAVINAQNIGFENITGDLIYGLPNMTSEKWKKNLKQFFDLKIPHLSAYHLTYEPNTVFKKFLKTGKIKEISEESSEDQFRTLMDITAEHDFLHYETSNFAKEGYFSKHNSAYWKQKKYLGIGTSAHSYDGDTRQFNIAKIKEYIDRVEANKTYYEREILSLADKYNDYIITTLRTIWGTDIDFINKNIGKVFSEFITERADVQIKSDHLQKKRKSTFFNTKGKIH